MVEPTRSSLSTRVDEFEPLAGRSTDGVVEFVPVEGRGVVAAFGAGGSTICGRRIAGSFGSVAEPGDWNRGCVPVGEVEGAVALPDVPAAVPAELEEPAEPDEPLEPLEDCAAAGKTKAPSAIAAMMEVLDLRMANVSDCRRLA